MYKQEITTKPLSFLDGNSDFTRTKLKMFYIRSRSHNANPIEEKPSFSPSRVKIGEVFSPKEISFNTEALQDFKSIAKVPLDLVVHPRSNKYMFRKAEENKSANLRLKMRFQKNTGKKRQSADPQFPLTCSKLINFFKNSHQRSEHDDTRAFKKVYPRDQPLINQTHNFTQKTRNPRPDTVAIASMKTTMNPRSRQGSQEDLSIMPFMPKPPSNPTIVIPTEKKRHLRSRSTVYREQRTPEKSRAITPMVINSFRTTFNGRLEPFGPENIEKYTEPPGENEIKVTKQDRAFVSKSNSPVKPKLVINMNKVIFSESQRSFYVPNSPDGKPTSPAESPNNTRPTSPEKSAKIPRVQSVPRSYRVESSPGRERRIPMEKTGSQGGLSPGKSGSSTSKIDLFERSVFAKIDSTSFFLPANPENYLSRNSSIHL